MIRRDDALRYHESDRNGKVEVRAIKPCFSPRDIRLAYLPGAAFPAAAIAADPAAAHRYTARGNLVAAVTNGTAVPGLGDVGPAAAKPMGEGIAILFKRLADIDVFDLELDARDPDRLVEAVRMLEPTFGGINLKDIRAPEGLEIYDRLRETMGIPVFHENLYGTAVVATAALINALDLAGKRADAVRVVICGAGTVGLGCARLLASLGVPRENLLLYDVHGLIHPGRDDLNPYQADFAVDHPAHELADGVAGADVFLGASAGGVLTQEMIRSMGAYPIVFAMATPEPEISYEEARAARRDVLVGTSRAQDPNAIVDLLSFPYIFRGALDVQASRITEGMLLAAARALADLAREDVVEDVIHAYGEETFTFGPEYLLPKPTDPRILARQSTAVASCAVAEGVARVELDTDDYHDALTVRMGTGREMMRQIILKSRQTRARVVFPEGNNQTILRACRILVDEGVASPIVLGDPEQVREAGERLGLDLGGVAVEDPTRSPRTEAYAEAYFRMRARRGVTHEMARARMTHAHPFATLMLHSGDADMMIAGETAHYPDALRNVIEVIGPAPGVQRISSMHMVLRPKEVYFLADCAVNINPDAEALAEIALLTARHVRSIGIEPRVALLSFSNFGGSDHPSARKVRQAAALARERAPDINLDGEIQVSAALDDEFRGRHFPFCELEQNANVLVFPDLQSGNLALNLLRKLSASVSVGPILMGTRRPVHLLPPGASAEQVVNLVALGVVLANEEG